MRQIFKKRFSMTETIGLLAFILMGIAGHAYAQTTVPFIFQTGETAKADEVNADFQFLADAIDTIELTPGPEGPQGLAGPQGDTGATGPQGPQGVKGDTGDPGPQGLQGVKGDKGDTGDTGLQGSAGQDGQDGSPDTADQVREKFFNGTSCTDPDNPNDIMVKVGPLCVDKYEASVWSVFNGTGTQYGASDDYDSAGFPDTGNWTTPLYAVSKAGVMPSSYITWFQAQQACAMSGKRLLTNAEWQMAAAGTPDPGLDGDGATTCNTNTAGPVATGTTGDCVSNWGVYDMVGNVWEWVADWFQGGESTWRPDNVSTTNDAYSNDRMTDVNNADQQGNGAGFPSALIRGGRWDDDTLAGVFTLSLRHGPAESSHVGFRCAR